MTEFSELGLSPATLQAVADAGYHTATPIQAEAIPVALQRRDVLGIAQTGTGKTAAFTLPMIDRLAAGRARARMPRALVIEPTRELADQVADAFEKYSKGQKLSWALLIGGVSFSDQEVKLDRGVDVLIATPGRLLDHFERGKLLMTGVQIMVVDEADRMLDMGFIPDLERIFKLTPPVKQTLFFSATMPPEITRLTKQFLKDPLRIEVARPATTAETITQYLVRIPSSDPKAKRAALRALVERADVKNGIVFCNRKSEVDIVAKSLRKHGFDASPIHGDLDQQTRMRTLDAFRSGELKLLVASDVAARGLDIPDVSHVFNFDVPHHADDYVHRIGRTGRAGRSGQAFMLVTPADAKNLDKVLKLIGKQPEEIGLDLDWANLKDEPRAGRGGRSGDRERSRGGRDRGPRREHGPRGPRREEQPREEHHREQRPENLAESAPEERRSERPHRQPRRAEGSTEERQAREERPPREQRPARDERPRREERSARDEHPRREERPQRQDRAPREDRRREHDREPSGEVRGFGQDVPAFLAKPPGPRGSGR